MRDTGDEMRDTGPSSLEMEQQNDSNDQTVGSLSLFHNLPGDCLSSRSKVSGWGSVREPTAEIRYAGQPGTVRGGPPPFSRHGCPHTQRGVCSTAPSAGCGR